MNTRAQESRSGTDPESSAPSATRIILWAGIAVGVLLVVAVGFTFISSSPRLDPNTPEGVIQRYLQAVVDGRRQEARSYLSDRLQPECNPGSPRYLSRDAYRIEWIETVMDRSTARVEVSVAEQDPGIFGSYYEFYASFSLELAEDGWRITHQEWPWYGCSESMLGPKDGNPEILP